MAMEMNTDREWLLRKAAQEDGYTVSVSGLISAFETVAPRSLYRVEFPNGEPLNDGDHWTAHTDLGSAQDELDSYSDAGDENLIIVEYRELRRMAGEKS